MTGLIPLVAFLAAILSFLSGFGLGTVLMPAMALVVPLEVAIALTAIVHFLNNLLKLQLMWRFARREIVLRFGLPAMLAAGGGAASLVWLQHHEQPLRWVIALLILFFVGWEYAPQRRTLAPSPRWLTLGGLVSGFFGGISGHQGAFRSAFLVRWRLTKEQFIGTGVVIACAIDLVRLAVYGRGFIWHDLRAHLPLLAAATAAALVGTALGRRLLAHLSLRVVHHLVACLMIGIAAGLMLGVL